MLKWGTCREPGRVFSAILVAALLGSCQGELPPAPEAAPVDPRFASAEALAEQIRQYLTNDPPNLGALYGIYYAENDYQRGLLMKTRQLQPLEEFGLAWIESEIRRENPYARLSDVMQLLDASITDRYTGRTVLKIGFDPDLLEMTDSEREAYEPFTYHCVKIGDRWWISCYTIERDERLMERLADQEMFDLVTSCFVPVFRELLPDLRQGGFRSDEQLNMAFGTYLFRRCPHLVREEDPDALMERVAAYLDPSRGRW